MPKKNEAKSKEVHDELERTLRQKLRATLGNKGIMFRKNTDTVKFSDVIFQFILPLFDVNTDDAEVLKGKIAWGIMVWNNAVANQNSGYDLSKSFIEVFPEFIKANPDDGLIEKFTLRKNAEFQSHRFFIIGWETKFVKGNLTLSVSVEQVN